MGKTLIIINNMHIGGIQKSLINLLKEIRDDYEITLMVLYPKGEYMKDIPSNIKIISGNKYTQILGMSQKEAKEKGFFCYIWRTVWTIITRIVGFKFTMRGLSKMQTLAETYDSVISFSQNSAYKQFYSGCNEMALYSTNASQKISFVHCDFSHYAGNCKYTKNLYLGFDKIACVSESVKRVMEKEIPLIKDRLYVVHNCSDFSSMEQLSQEQISYKKTKFTLFTSARFTSEKGIPDTIKTISDIKKDGYDLEWVVAGDGPEYNIVKENIKKYNVEEDVILLGYTYNPYPYFKICDAVLVPSYEEAAPMVFGEAQYFHKTIITTNTLSAKELVADTGYICSREKLKATIEHVINESEKNRKKNKEKLTNDKAVREFKEMSAAGRENS